MRILLAPSTGALFLLLIAACEADSNGGPASFDAGAAADVTLPPPTDSGPIPVDAAEAGPPPCAQSVVSAEYRGCVQRLDGSVRCSSYGGTLAEPTDLGTDIVKLVAGDDFVCALSSDGSIWCTGTEASFLKGEPSGKLTVLGDDNADFA